MTPDQRKALEEHLKLINVAVDSLAKNMATVSDANMVLIMQQSLFRLFESRYWLTEALSFPDAQTTPTKPEQKKVTAN